MLKWGHFRAFSLRSLWLARELTPSLQHYCILDPQWLIDTITYVVRDFKLHRFLRDRSAMRADGGKAWDLFLESGILEEKLLNHLWLGEGGHRNFLLRLMMKIGLFALLPKASEDEENQFFVPCSLSLVGTAQYILPNLSSHLAINTNNEAFSFKFAFGSFLPTGMFERVLVRLVNDYWPRGMTERIPQMLPNAAHLLMASGKHAVTLTVSFVTNTIEAFISTKEEAALVLPHIKGAIRAINEEMYHSRLKINFDVSDVLHDNEMQFRKCPVDDLGPLENRLAAVQVEDSAQITELAAFFASAKIDTDDAQKYARSIAMCDPEADVDMLKDMYDALKDKDPMKSMHAASKTFREAVLKDEYGISKCYVQIKIVNALEKCPPPREEKQYLLGFFDVRNLDRAQKEKEKIRSSLARSKLKMADYDMGPLSEVFDKTRGNNNVVLHLAMHGEAKSATCKPTLAFLEHGAHPEPDLLAATIASGCLREDGKRSGSIECVFLNACKGREVAKLLRNQYAVPFVVFWETAVSDRAAEAFAEEFYRTLCEDKNSFRNFDNAFERAKVSLMQRRWIVDGKGGDPESAKDLLLKRQLDENDLRLEAAGIPRMYGPSDDYLLRTGERKSEIEKSLKSDISEQQQHQQQQSSSSRGGYDELTIFQAAPLVYRDNHNEIHPLDALDFDTERKVLIQSLEEAEENEVKIKINFETATVERLGTFLASSKAQVIHISCHGQQAFVAFEDGRGGAHFLTPEDLKRLFKAGRINLQFVFVAACHSELTGQAFIDAGVRHVLCCEKDSPIMNNAALVFSRQLYQSLASGKTLINSFNLAKETVSLWPTIANAEAEVQKYILLPKDGNHDVRLFFPREERSASSRQRSLRLFPESYLPNPPPNLVGQEKIVYNVLQQLRMGCLIKMKGGGRSGMQSLAKAVSRYVSAREHSFSLDEVIWLPFWQTPTEDFLSSLKRLCGLLQSESLGLKTNNEYNGLWTKVCGSLDGKSMLVVVDPNDPEASKPFLPGNLQVFLSDVFNRVQHVVVVLVCEDGFDIPEINGCETAEVGAL